MTKIKDLSQAIVQALEEYTDEVTKGIEKEKRADGKQAVEMLKEASPKKTGEYAEGWTVSKVDSKQVIHNKTHYQRAHLLEYGHASRDGGRVPGKAHIRPVEEFIVDKFARGVEKVIKG